MAESTSATGHRRAVPRLLDSWPHRPSAGVGCRLAPSHWWSEQRRWMTGAEFTELPQPLPVPARAANIIKPVGGPSACAFRGHSGGRSPLWFGLIAGADRPSCWCWGVIYARLSRRAVCRATCFAGPFAAAAAGPCWWAHGRSRLGPARLRPQSAGPVRPFGAWPYLGRHSRSSTWPHWCRPWW